MNRREQMDVEFHEDLKAAQTCAQRALNALYADAGPKRGILYRMALGRAQSILMRLVMKEVNRKEK